MKRAAPPDPTSPVRVGAPAATAPRSAPYRRRSPGPAVGDESRQPDLPTPRRARPDDAPELARCARAAYARYVERIGREPAPMRADFAALVAAGRVRVIESGGAVAGYAVALVRGDAMHLENVAVFPERSGEGLGGCLIASVESDARRLGCRAVELYTNAAMHENLALYPRLGYVETGRRSEDGFDRVYFRKALGGDGVAGDR